MAELNKDLKAYLENCIPEAHKLLKELCLIPAPSGFEDKRAEFVKNWLEEQGAKGVYTDKAKKVLDNMKITDDKRELLDGLLTYMTSRNN